MTSAVLLPESSTDTLSPRPDRPALDPRIEGAPPTTLAPSTTRAPGLITPYGRGPSAELVDLRLHADLATTTAAASAEPGRRSGLRAHADRLPSRTLSDRQLCDLALLAVGGFSPVDGFLGQEDYRRVLAEGRLEDGTLFPIPITLSLEPGPDLQPGREIGLRDPRGRLLAVQRIDEIYAWNADDEARAVLGTTDPAHPLVREMATWGSVNVAGRLRVLALPWSDRFPDLLLEPRETRRRLRALGRSDVVAFQTRNPLHRAHEALTRRAAEQVGGTLLLHPVVGVTKPGDIDTETRVRTYRALAEHHYEPSSLLLAVLPLAMRMAGPREALWHAIVRRNYGANHLVVGRDHASPGVDSEGRPYWGPYDAQDLVRRHFDEVGVAVVPFREMVYLPEEDRYEERARVAEGTPILSLSGTQVREQYLARGRRLPDWFTRPEVAQILEDARTLPNALRPSAAAGG